LKHWLKYLETIAFHSNFIAEWHVSSGSNVDLGSTSNKVINMPAIIVNNQAQLDAAIKVAKGGDTILLAAGNYTSLTLTKVNPTTNLTIQSLDAKNPAVVSTLWMTSSSNITLKNLNVMQDYKPAQEWETANRILSSKNITVDGVRFSGGSGDPSNSSGVGLAVRDASNIKFVNSSIDHFMIGMNALGVDGMVVQGNNFHDNRRDHTNFAEMNNVVIDSNNFTGLYPVGDEHPDAIQFMTSGRTKANTNVTISNNVVMQGDGRATQGFFLGEEAGNLPYENLTIKNNLIYISGMYHGINVIHGNNVNIDSNSVISASDDKSFWIRVENVTGKITNNLADDILTSGTNNVDISKNILLTKDSVTLRKLSDINLIAKAKLSGLLVSGIGYTPPVGSAAAALVSQQLSAGGRPTGAQLLLDVNFTASGVVDYSTWSSDETIKPANLASVSNGMYKVATGAGLEFARGTSRQIFGLSAFTLNFDMKRDGVTAPAGQIMGVFQSWGVSLRADGELTFSMTNAAGKSFTLATSGAKILDTNTHKIAVTYDGARGTALIYVDGVVKGSAAMSGTTTAAITGSMREQGSQGLWLGSPFGAAFSGSVGDIEMRDGALSAAQILALNASSTLTSPTKAADVVKAMVTKSLADSAATLATATSWGGATAVPATLSLAGAVGTAAASQSPLAAMLATVSGSGTLSTRTGTLSTLSTGRSATYDLHYA
jgi:pectate lyase